MSAAKVVGFWGGVCSLVFFSGGIPQVQAGSTDGPVSSYNLGAGPQKELSRGDRDGSDKGSSAAVGGGVGNRLPDLVSVDQNGEAVSLSALIGHGRAAVYFYSGCCGHCAKLLPGMSRLAGALKQQGIPVIGVQYMGTSKTCALKMSEYELTGKTLADPDGKFCQSLGIGEFTLLTVDEQGIVRYRGEGRDLPVLEKGLGMAAGSLPPAPAPPAPPIPSASPDRDMPAGGGSSAW